MRGLENKNKLKRRIKADRNYSKEVNTKNDAEKRKKIIREERGTKGTEVEEEVLKAIKQKFKTNASRPCINQRWSNVWDALTLLSLAERIRAADCSAMSAIETECGKELLDCVKSLQFSDTA